MQPMSEGHIYHTVVTESLPEEIGRERGRESHLMNNQRKPSIFLGSSVEGLDVARAIQKDLRYEADCIVWPQGVFGVGSIPLMDPIGMADRVDFAIFVFTPDDVVRYRETGKTRVRASVSGNVRGASKVLSRQTWRSLMAQRAKFMAVSP
ncbi:TIR domain-containing protein [Brevibacillus sp. H7]|uniref:TIR domain-containing protein n=1 Tax=Brevibacillus sp. H7 TaxID=3349138 RepID=UPI00380C4997